MIQLIDNFKAFKGLAKSNKLISRADLKQQYIGKTNNVEQTWSF